MVAPGKSLSRGGMKKGGSGTLDTSKMSLEQVVAESNRLNPPKKNSRAGMTAEQKIAQRRQEQAANPERFQSVIKNKSKVLKKTTNMGGDYKAVNKVVTADRNRRRQTGDGEFRRAQQAAGTRSANKLTKQAAAPRQSKAKKGDGMAAVAKKLGTVKPKKSAEVIAKEKKAKASKAATNRFKKVLG